jgi:hypothetical protein
MGIQLTSDSAQNFKLPYFQLLANRHQEAPNEGAPNDATPDDASPDDAGPDDAAPDF